jgi:hypothetical protein
VAGLRPLVVIGGGLDQRPDFDGGAEADRGELRGDLEDCFFLLAFDQEERAQGLSVLDCWTG